MVILFPNWHSMLLWFGCGQQQKRHVAAPPPAGVRRRMERNRQKLVGRDKGSLTEQQTKGTGTTTIQIRRKHNNEPHDPDSRSPEQDWRSAPPQAVSEFPPHRHPPPEPSVTSHGKEYQALFGQVGSGPTPWLCPFLESGEN